MATADTLRERILDAAEEVFGRYGFRKTAVADIVRESGAARATVYKYFPTKGHIFRAVVHREVADILDLVSEAVDRERGTEARLRVGVRAYATGLMERMNLFRLTRASLTDVIPSTPEEAREVTEAGRALVSRILREGVENGEVSVQDTDLAADTFILAFKGAFMTALTGQMTRAEHMNMVDRLIGLLWNGLKVREEAA